MDESHSQERWSRNPNEVDAPSISRGDSVQTGGGWIKSVVRAVPTIGQRYLDAILGGVLVLAGALKEQQLLADPSVGRASGLPRELLMGASVFELAFGGWLLTGLYRQLTRWLALAWFTSLAAVALAQSLGGAPSCACLGELHANPSLMFAIDVAVVAALAMWSPNGQSSGRRLPAVLCLSLIASAAVFSLAAVPREKPLFMEIDLGVIAQGGRKQHAFQCRNDNGARVEVAAVETSCPCARLRLERAEVPAGQFLEGNVVLDLGIKPRFVGDVVIEAKGLTRRGQIVLVLVIRAHVQPALQAEMGTL